MEPSTSKELLHVSGQTKSQHLEGLLLVKPKSKAPQRPNIVNVGHSKALQQAKTLLPELAAAETDLKRRIEQGQDVDIEHLDSVQSHYVEMNVGLIQKTEQDDWSADSDPDSPISSQDRDNEFTSDSDPDSSGQSSGSSTCSSSPDCVQKNGSNEKKAILIEEVEQQPPAKTRRQK